MGGIQSVSSSSANPLLKSLSLSKEAVTNAYAEFKKGYQENLVTCPGFGLTRDQLRSLLKGAVADTDSLFDLLKSNDMVDGIEVLTVLAWTSKMSNAEKIEFMFSCNDFEGAGQMGMGEMSIAVEFSLLGLTKLFGASAPSGDELDSKTAQIFESLQLGNTITRPQFCTGIMGQKETSVLLEALSKLAVAPLEERLAKYYSKHNAAKSLDSRIESSAIVIAEYYEGDEAALDTRLKKKYKESLSEFTLSQSAPKRAGGRSGSIGGGNNEIVGAMAAARRSSSDTLKLGAKMVLAKTKPMSFHQVTTDILAAEKFVKKGKDFRIRKSLKQSKRGKGKGWVDHMERSDSRSKFREIYKEKSKMGLKEKMKEQKKKREASKMSQAQSGLGLE